MILFEDHSDILIFLLLKLVGWSALNGNIAGDADNFEDAGADDNINCKVATKYSKVTFKFKWDGSAVTDYTLTFTK